MAPIKAVMQSSWDRGDDTTVYGYEVFTEPGTYEFEFEFHNPEVCHDGEAHEFMIVVRSEDGQIEVRNHEDERLFLLKGGHFFIHAQHKNFRTAATPWETIYDLRRGTDIDASGKHAMFWFDAPEREASSIRSARAKCVLRAVEPAELSRSARSVL